MKLSTKGRYGLRALIDLALYSENETVSIASISARQNISESYRSINFSRFGLVLISAVRKVTENNLLGLSSSREEILDLERKSMEEKIASRDEIIVMGTRKNITDFLSSVQTN